MSEKKLTRKEAENELFRRGNLSWICHSVQREIYNIFYNAPEFSTLVWLLARQSGKSYLLAILAIEQALRKPKSIIKVVTDTKVHMRNIFIPIIDDILSKGPADCRAEYNKADFCYTFMNGSQIQLAGSDGGNYERLRGQKSDLVLIDEAGFCDNLFDVVKSVLLPTTTHTGGKIILASTPSSDPDHDFNKFIEEAELNGTITKKTIYDNPLLSKEKIERIIKEMGGETSPKFRREYLCELARDEDSVIFPEFDDILAAQIVKEWPEPPFYDCYVAMDLGYTDLTALVFGYYDFRADKIVIQDELIFDFKKPNHHLELLTKHILEKEAKIWTNPLTNEQKTPHRVSDINHIVTQEIRKLSNQKLSFQIPNKDEKQSRVNTLRVMIANQKVIIHPRCVNLIRHLKNCKWKDTTVKRDFARSPDTGHYDAVDALLYMVKSIVFTKNPYPSSYGVQLRDSFGTPIIPRTSGDGNDIYRKIFGYKKKS